MKIIYAIVLLSIITVASAQSEKDDYEIYSVVLNDRLENMFKNKIDKIILVSQYKDKFDDSNGMFSEFIYDLADTNQVKYLYAVARPFETATIYNENLALRKLVAKFEKDFKNHPILKPELLIIGKTTIQTISHEKYYSYFGKKMKKIDHGWKKIERTYKTKLVIELSKIEHSDNYASLYYGHHCGGLCGEGRLVLLEKVDGSWKIIGEFNLWYS